MGDQPSLIVHGVAGHFEEITDDVLVTERELIRSKFLRSAHTRHDTVGPVARDYAGNLAVATSTGCTLN